MMSAKVTPISYEQPKHAACHICCQDMTKGVFVAYAIHPGARFRENTLRICDSCARQLADIAESQTASTSDVLRPTSDAEGVSDAPFHQEPA